MRIRSAIAAFAASTALVTVAPVDAAPMDRAPRTGASVSTPELRLPPQGIKGHALWDAWFEPSEFGYEEQEYFVHGTAVDAAGNEADYTTRFIVFRPTPEPGDGPDFNGTAVIDWTNVTSQAELAVDSTQALEMFLREGFAWVHVSAQAAGVGEDNGNTQTPKGWDNVRYADLHHPGDRYAFSMFSQVAKVLKDGSTNGIDPMNGLDLEYVLASGQSQSAGHLSTYVKNWQSVDDVIDGFLIHGTYRNDGPSASPVPVIHLESDADFAATAQENVPGNVVLWEVAGASHVDYWLGYIKLFPVGDRANGSVPKLTRDETNAVFQQAGNYGEQLAPGFAACIPLGGAMPMRYVTSAAIVQLDKWVRTGDAAPTAPPVQASPAGTVDRIGDPTAEVSYGNTRGGIRLGPVEHPVATYLSDACSLGGFTVAWSEAQIIAAHGTHADYFRSMEATTAQNVADGFVLQADAADLLGRVCDARNRFLVDHRVEYCDPWVAAGAS